MLPTTTQAETGDPTGDKDQQYAHATSSTRPKGAKTTIADSNTNAPYMPARASVHRIPERCVTKQNLTTTRSRQCEAQQSATVHHSQNNSTALQSAPVHQLQNNSTALQSAGDVQQIHNPNTAHQSAIKYKQKDFQADNKAINYQQTESEFAIKINLGEQDTDHKLFNAKSTTDITSEIDKITKSNANIIDLQEMTEYANQFHQEVLLCFNFAINNYTNKSCKNNNEFYSNYVINNKIQEVKLWEYKDLLELKPTKITPSNILGLMRQAKPGDEYSDVTLLSQDILNAIKAEINIAEWNKLDKLHRITLQEYVLGFADKFESAAFAERYVETTFPTKQVVEDYLQGEIQSKRIVEIPISDLAFFISSRILRLVEKKFLADGTYSHEKQRFVYNNIHANSFMIPPDYLISYKMPDILVLFSNDRFYNELCSSKVLSTRDKLNYYRQWHVSPLNYMFQIIFTSFNNTPKKAYIDLRGRMGGQFSAFHSQRISDLIDHLFFSRTGKYAITIQDDTLILNTSCSEDSIYGSINSSFGLKFNDGKSVSTKKLVNWAGFTINLESHSIVLLKKRLNKMTTKLEFITNSKTVTKRDIAQYLGMLFSARAILLSKQLQLSPVLYCTRKRTQLFCNYYDDKVLDFDKIYDTKVDIHSIMIEEMNLAFSIVKQEANFSDVREGILNDMHKSDETFSNTTIQKQKVPNDIIFSDASDTMAGIAVYVNRTAQFSRKFADFSIFVGSYLFNAHQQTWSINNKELNALVKALYLYIAILDRLNILNTRRMLVCYIDNEAMRSLASSRKVSLRSVRLGVHSKAIFFLELTYNKHINFNYLRVSSEQNKLADILSRRSHTHNTFLEKFDCYRTLIGSEQNLNFLNSLV